MDDIHRLGQIIWETSRADESTISYAGANIVARAILASDWLAEVRAQARREALSEATDEMGRLLDGFAMRGAHTRARWAEQWLRQRAEEVGGDE